MKRRGSWTRAEMCFGFCPEMSRSKETTYGRQYGPRDLGGEGLVYPAPACRAVRSFQNLTMFSGASRMLSITWRA